MRLGAPGRYDARVLEPDQFGQLPAMQHGDPARRISKDALAQREPTCEWQMHQIPYPQV